jgi:transposase
VVQTLGAAQAHHGYLFANARATRVKLIVHDGWGVWCAARRLNAGHFVWPRGLDAATPLALTQEQFDALIVGLPWQRLHERRVITRVRADAGGAIAEVADGGAGLVRAAWAHA